MMDKNLALSCYALANYVEENREAALNSSFKSKKLKEFITSDSPDAVDDQAVRSFIVDQCDDPVLVSMQLELLMQKDPEELIARMIDGANEENNTGLKEQKLECLLLMAGRTFDLEEGIPKLDQLQNQCEKLTKEGLSKLILDRLTLPEPPAAALALYLGSDRPWVRRRLESTKDVKVWQELVVDNFNSSPKTVFDGFSHLPKGVDDASKQRLVDSSWSRPDCQIYMSERSKQLGTLSPEAKLEDVPEVGDLINLLAWEPKKATKRAESIAELLELLDAQLAARLPDKSLQEYFISKGCSQPQAELRAAYCHYAGIEGVESANPTAARRLAASLQAPRQVDRTASVPASFGGWKKRLQDFTQKCVTAFAGFGAHSEIDPEDLGQTSSAEGYQSWEHKDAVIAQIEAKLEKEYDLKLQGRSTDDPWKILHVKGKEQKNATPEPDGPDI